MSMNSVPGCAPLAAPRSPNSTSSTCGASGTHVMTTSHDAPTPAGSPPSCAPSTPSRSTGSRLRCAHTVTSKPARSSDAAIGSPIAPTPIIPTFIAIEAAAYGARDATACGRTGRRVMPSAPRVRPPFAAAVSVRRLRGRRAGRGGRARGGHCGSTLAAYAWAQALVTSFQLMVHYANDYFDRECDAHAGAHGVVGRQRRARDGRARTRASRSARRWSCAALGLARRRRGSRSPGNATVAWLGLAIARAGVVLLRAAGAARRRAASARSTRRSSSRVLVPLAGYAAFAGRIDEALERRGDVDGAGDVRDDAVRRAARRRRRPCGGQAQSRRAAGARRARGSSSRSSP